MPRVAKPRPLASRSLRILMIASEAQPFSKTGGLADVATALSKALGRLGHDVTLVTNAGCDGLAPLIAPFGLRLRSVDLSEFVKAGGSAKCLVLNLE